MADDSHASDRRCESGTCVNCALWDLAEAVSDYLTAIPIDDQPEELLVPMHAILKAANV